MWEVGFFCPVVVEEGRWDSECKSGKGLDEGYFYEVCCGENESAE